MCAGEAGLDGQFVDKAPDTPGRLPGCVRGSWHRRGMTRYTVVRWCSGCAADVAFEQPGCLDGHEGDCPEWVCVECGDALLIGFSLAEPAGTAVPTSNVA